jgi:uncharacterized protein with HEPN domain
MSPRDLVYVEHMLDTAKKAVGKTASLTRDAYDADENLRLALTHLVQVIGEAGRHVSREFCLAHPEIQWADIIGRRIELVTIEAPSPLMVLTLTETQMPLEPFDYLRKRALRRRNIRRAFARGIEVVGGPVNAAVQAALSRPFPMHLIELCAPQCF